MGQSDREKQVLSRRDALKALASATGAVSLSMLPNGWEKPVIEVGALPAHAQVTGVAYNISCSADGGGSAPDRVPQNGIITNIQATVTPIPPVNTVVSATAEIDTIPSYGGSADGLTNASGVANFPDFNVIAEMFPDPPPAAGSRITFTFFFADQATFGPATCSTVITVEATEPMSPGLDSAPQWAN